MARVVVHVSATGIVLPFSLHMQDMGCWGRAVCQCTLILHYDRVAKSGTVQGAFAAVLCKMAFPT